MSSEEDRTQVFYDGKPWLLMEEVNTVFHRRVIDLASHLVADSPL